MAGWIGYPSNPEWPYTGTIIPLNYSAREVLEFFNCGRRSGLAAHHGAMARFGSRTACPDPPKIGLPKLQPVDLAPRQAWPGL